MQERITIRTKDGKEIQANCYLGGEPAGRVVIIGAAATVTQARYRPIAKLLRQLAYDVITFDYRGVGESSPRKLTGYHASLHQWAVQDADAVIRYVHNHFPYKEIIYIGHGISGEIIGLAQASQYIHKLVLVSSALTCEKLFPLRHRIKKKVLKLMARIITPLVGFFPGDRLGYLRDLPRGVVLEWANWCDNTNGLFGTYPDNNYRKLQVPLLAFSFSDDWHTPPRAVKALLDKFETATITWHHVDVEDQGFGRVRHEGFFEARMKTSLWETLERWINTDHYRQEIPSLKKSNPGS